MLRIYLTLTNTRIVMEAFSTILQAYHLKPEPEETHIQYMKIGAQKRARMDKTPHKIAHLLIETLYVDVRDAFSTNFELFHFCREKHRLFNIKYFTVQDAESRAEFEQLFFQVQQCYNGFTKLSRIWRLKRAPIQITTDLLMTPLNPTHKHTFVLYQHGKLYYFAVRDLCKILINALTNSAFLFSEPQPARNPYNNVLFNKADLYNMYFRIRESSYFVPTILHLWFRYGFDVYKLRKLHEHEFAEYAITNYVNGLNTPQLCEEIYEMIYELGFKNDIQPNPTFSADRFAADMKPFLSMYIKVLYCPDKIVSANLRRELQCKLRWFSNVYPYYGKLTTGPVSPMQSEYTEVFMTSHMYSEAQYTNYIMWGKYDAIDRPVSMRFVEGPPTNTRDDANAEADDEGEGEGEEVSEDELSEVSTEIDEDIYDP